MSSTEKHTPGDGPGEWTLANPPEFNRESDQTRIVPILANKAPNGDQMPAHVHGTTPELRLARARLMCAAPGMRKLLERASEILESRHAEFYAIGRLSAWRDPEAKELHGDIAAILKAAGGAS